MDDKINGIKESLDKVKKAVQAYENNDLDEFTLKHILQDAAMIFTHAALTGKVRDFRH